MPDCMYPMSSAMMNRTFDLPPCARADPTATHAETRIAAPMARVAPAVRELVTMCCLRRTPRMRGDGRVDCPPPPHHRPTAQTRARLLLHALADGGRVHVLRGL